MPETARVDVCGAPACGFMRSQLLLVALRGVRRNYLRTVIHAVIDRADTRQRSIHGRRRALKNQCKCVAVFPHVIKGAIGYGARYGQGVMSCRGEQGQWSPPSFVSLAGGSVGFQIGAESTDLVLFFMNERGARSLMTGSKF